MRIAKAQTIGTLQMENAKLAQQVTRCVQQKGKLANFTVGELRGKSASSARETIRMRAAILEAHKSFYDRLLVANNRNKSLVAALPETSSGVLDTDVATRRRDAARQQIGVLESQRAQALRSARSINETICRAFEGSADVVAGTTTSLANLDAIGGYYDVLIEAQRNIVRLNEEILEKAERYDRESSDAYRAVDTSALGRSVESSKSFLSGKGWGDVSWALSAGAGMGMLKERAGKREHGKAEFEKSLCSKSVSASTYVGDMVAGGVMSGSLLGVHASVQPYNRDSKVDRADDKTPFVGYVAKAEVYGARGELEGHVGDLAHASMEGQVLAGAVSGVLGASLSLGEKPSASLEASAVAEGAVIASEGKARLGVSDYNVNVRGEGKVLTGTAGVTFKAGLDGAEARAGAEAYVATGELSGGLTLLGVRFDAGVEGKVGGAGASAQARVGPSSIQGKIGVGLGLGAGVEVNVDWSGAENAWHALGRNVEDWWNRLAGG